jgi:DNA-binding transcriptional LysR family regulator
MNITLDQLQVFLSVVEQGSFSAAARGLSRGQSAVTYTIQKLEAQIGEELFDRSAYRPVLSDAGRALLPYARRIAEDVGAFDLQARSIASGLEAELTLAVDSMFPMPILLLALKAFQDRYPSVQPRLYVENLGRTVQLVLDSVCAVGLALSSIVDTSALLSAALTEVDLVMVAAPSHPLARIKGPLSLQLLRDQVQLVLTDRSGLTGKRDFGVYATRVWRVGDLGAKHVMLKAGIGFGSMPMHMIAEDLKAGTLARLVLPDSGGASPMPVLPLGAITRIDTPVGPATRWMIDHLVEISRAAPARRSKRGGALNAAS